MSTNKPVLSQAVWLSAAVTEFECCLLRLTVSSSCFHILWNMINPPACDLYVCWGRGLYFTHTTDSVLKIMTEMISKTFCFYSLIAWLIAQEYFIAFVRWPCKCDVTFMLYGKVMQCWNKVATGFDIECVGPLLIIIWTHWSDCDQNVILSHKLGKVSLLFLMQVS